MLATHLARAYTGNYPILTLQNSYHGTVGAQLLTNIGTWNHDDLPRTVGVVPSCFPDMYRGPWSTVEEASEMYAKQVKDVIEFNTSGKVASLSAEPVQGAGGINPLPKGFWRWILAVGPLFWRWISRSAAKAAAQGSLVVDPYFWR